MYGALLPVATGADVNGFLREFCDFCGSSENYKEISHHKYPLAAVGDRYRSRHQRLGWKDDGLLETGIESGE